MMRLFIAVLFDEEIKASLSETAERLKREAIGGTFTNKENLHLTVNFIGETERLEEVKEAMREALEVLRAESFPLVLGGFGRFKRSEGDIYWVSVEREEVLWRIQKELVMRLRAAGFYDIDDRDYKPHITLGRRVKVNQSFDSQAFARSIQPMSMKVERISLMKSERVVGKLTYTEIFQLGLK
jgi:RNA 2',3'-cyclic 3'-phosphodiesterase